MARQPKPTAPPLATTIRQALASGWHSLAALDTLTAARGSDARRLVHEALRALRGEGCVLEERVGKAGVEVRLAPATLPAPRPADGQPGDLSPEDIEAIRVALLEAEEDSDGAAYTNEIAPLSPAAAARMAGLIEHPPAPSEALRALCRGEDEPDDYTRFHAALAVGVAAFDTLPICGGATCPDCEHAITQLEDHALTCANGRRDAPWWDAKRAAYGAEIEAHVKASTPPGASAQERAVAFAGEAIRRRREGLYKAPALDAPTPPVGQAAPGALTLPAPRPDDGSGWGTPALDEPLSPAERERAETLLMADECTAAEIEELRGYEAREESSRGARLRREAEAVKASQEAAPPQPGPSSRCAVCEVTYARHEEARRRGGGELHTFTPRPRGRPPAPERAPVAPIPNAAPAILPRVRQCRTPGPVVDVDGGRVERAPFPPCVDCGEEPGTCPEGRCRDCDIEHLMTAGSCRECLTWIMREDMAGPREKQHSIGCSLAAEPCYPRNAAEYIATRKMRYGWTPPQGWKLTGCAAGAAAEPETSMGRGDAPVLPPAQQRTARRAEANEREAAALAQIKGPPPCRPPLCYRDDIHEPARVRGFARPLCERHRAWVEGAGGTVASEADVAALHAT